jgi:uncharacterized protein with PQ loop repeat
MDLASLIENRYILSNSTYFDCTPQPIYTYALGIFLCIGGIVSYIPQYYYLIKTKQHKGINELSLFLLNLGSFCLFGNSLILNWWKFNCYDNCSAALCTANLESVIQIGVGCIVPFPLYLLFVKYKYKASRSIKSINFTNVISDNETLINTNLINTQDKSEDQFISVRRGLYIVLYIGIYIIFALLMIIVGLVEKYENPNNWEFFYTLAKIFGVMGAICFSIVWIPQIIELIRTQDQGTLSLAMFMIQGPGNGVIITFQILYHQDWSTWIAYVITLVEQLLIIIILIIFKCRIRKQNKNTITILDN